MPKLPDFLLGYPVNDKHPLRRVPRVSWMGLHPWLIANKDRLKMRDYARLMVIELERHPPRLDILTRLKGKFDIERRTAERDQLEAYITKLK